MMCKPLIGLNMDYRRAQTSQPAHAAITAGYFDCILAAGGIPVIMPPLQESGDIEGVLDRLDGAVLIGGADLDPRRDGFMLHPACKLLDARRESFDRNLMRHIAARQMPVFGIGLGMQLMNVVMGGNLYLHLPEDRPDALPHRDLHDPAHRHGLSIKRGSLLDRVFGDGEIRVNSRHHMAIDDLAAGFSVTARSPDGVIEAIEYQGDWFAIGTQFHPEGDAASALDIRIFEEFVEGIRERRFAFSARLAA